MTHSLWHYLAMSFPPFFAGAPQALAGPADALSSSVVPSPADEIEEAKMTAVAVDTPAAAETAIAVDTPAPAGRSSTFNVWNLLERFSAEKTAVAADTPGPALAAQAPAAAAPALADLLDIATPPVVSRVRGEGQEEKGRSCGEAVPVNNPNAWEDCFDDDEVNYQPSDDGLGATTEEEFARGNDDGIVKRRTANAQPKEITQRKQKDMGVIIHMYRGVSSEE